MSSKANHFKLGLFVIGGVACLLGALLLLGVGRSLREPMLIETYLDQSVQGLDAGSKVKYRGVDIGKVHAITFTRARYELDKPEVARKPYVLIEVAVDTGVVQEMGGNGFGRYLAAEIDRGLRFRLNALGITGLSYLELDYVESYRYPPLEVTWKPENLYIPSAPGTLTKLLTSVEQVFRKLEGADLGLVLTNLNQLLTTTESEIRGVRLSAVSAQATNLLSELRESNQALQVILKNPQWQAIPTEAVSTITEIRSKIEKLDLNGLIARLERTLSSVDALLSGKDADLGTALSNLRVLTENLRALSEAVKAQPSSILLGAPPRPVQPKP